MRYEVKSLGAWAFVKVSFFLNMIIGFALGLIYAGLLGLMMVASSASPFEAMGPMPIDLEGIGPAFFILMPIFGAAAGAIFHTVFGLAVIGVYNLIAKLIGGFEMTLEPIAQAEPIQPVQSQPVSVAPSYQPPPPPPQPPTPQDVVRPTPPPPPPAGDQPRSDSNPETP